MDFMNLYYLVLQDPKTYVTTLLKIHRRYDYLVCNHYEKDSGYVAALDKVNPYFFYRNLKQLLLFLYKWAVYLCLQVQEVGITEPDLFNFH